MSGFGGRAIPKKIVEGEKNGYRRSCGCLSWK